jgi:hypothetical protein
MFIDCGGGSGGTGDHNATYTTTWGGGEGMGGVHGVALLCIAGQKEIIILAASAPFTCIKTVRGGQNRTGHACHAQLGSERWRKYGCSSAS